MKISYRVTAILICITLLFSGFVFAEGEGEIWLYGMTVMDSLCTFTGRVAGKDAGEVALRLVNKKDASDVISLTQPCLADGSFVVSVTPKATEYTVTVSASGMDGISFSLDMESMLGVAKLGAAKGYIIESLTINQEMITLSGKHAAGSGKRMSLKVYDEKNPADYGMHATAAVEQFAADENGNFSVAYMVPQGDYVLELAAETLPVVSCSFVIGDYMQYMIPDESHASTLMAKLNTYADWIQEGIHECNQKGIATDYEKANLAIIKKFIEYIGIDDYRGDSSRWEEYNRTLTELALETLDALKAYLDGSRISYPVPHYVTSDITMDGASLCATVELGEETEERPVFFTGYGQREAAGDLLPMFSDIGVNIIQKGLALRDVLAPYNPNLFEGWDYVKGNVTEVKAERTTEEAKSGSYSLKVVNPNESRGETYILLHQKITVKPNTTYEYGGSIKGTSRRVGVNLEGLGDDKKGQFFMKTSGDWQTYTMLHTTAPDETEVNFTLCINDISDCYLDDFYFKESGTEQNLLSNAGFEETSAPESELEKDARETYGLYARRRTLTEYGQILALAEKHNVLVDVNFSMEPMPQFVYDLDPEMATAGHHYLPFALDNETARDVVSFYTKSVLSEAAKHRSVYSVSIANEPQVNTRGVGSESWIANLNTEYYKPKWVSYLTNKYSSITELNKVYGTSYTDFEQVTMPTRRDATPLVYDYVQFNTSVMTDYISWLSDNLRSAFPQFKYHAKFMMYFRDFGQDCLFQGTDIEKVQGKLDLNGTDGNINFGGETPFSSLMRWYDYMRSANDVPAWDSELHILEDTAENGIDYHEDMADYIAASTWNGAVHGRGASIQWIWDLEEFGMSHPNSNMAYRPAEVAANAKAMLDLQRLSKEVTALQKMEAEVGILYSRTGLLYHDNIAVHTAAYEDVLFSGQKVGYVTDTDPSTMNQYKLLIVPEVKHVTADVFDAVNSYLANGGQVLLLGNDCLRYDENNQKRSISDYWEMYLKVDTQSTVREKITEMNLSKILLVDAQTGETADDVEWTYAPYGNGFLVNTLNYDTDVKQVQVKYNGVLLEETFELIAGNASEVHTLQPMKPALLYFGYGNIDLLDESGNILQPDLKELKAGVIRYNPSVTGTVILALYKDDELIQASLEQNTMAINLEEEGNYRLMATVWDMETMTALTKSMNIVTEVEK